MTGDGEASLSESVIYILLIVVRYDDFCPYKEMIIRSS